MVHAEAMTTLAISGRAGRGRYAGIIYVTGRTSAAPGTLLSVLTRVQGVKGYTVAGTSRVMSNGRFTWREKASKPVYAYVRISPDVQSNRVLIRPMR